jgi:hypothetical protein
VWAVVPISLSVTSEGDDYVGGGRAYRFTPSEAVFRARCYGSEVQAWIAGRSHWFVYLAAPRDTPLRVGTYENAVEVVQRRGAQPGIMVAGEGNACSNSVGRFVISDVAIAASGEVQRLVATFEQRCSNLTGWLRGELRLIAPEALPSYNSTCLR